MLEEKLLDINGNEVRDDRFYYPNQLSRMTVRRAFEYLDLIRSGHGYIYEDWFDILKTLILKCRVNPDFIFSEEGSRAISIVSSSDYNGNYSEIKAHIIDEPIDEKYVNSRIELLRKKRSESRWDDLSIFRKMFLRLRKKDIENVDFDKLETSEINNLYVKKRVK